MNETKKIYNFKNEPTSSILHLVGAALSLIGLVFLIIIGALKGDIWHVISFSVFGVGLFLLYLASTLFHFFNNDTITKKVFERLDHSMIYVLIAATYTPVCLTALRGVFGYSIFIAIWVIAIIGISLKSTGVLKPGFWSTVLYVLMGWIIVIVIFPLIKIVHLSGVFWLLIGGIFYTIGAIFYQFDQVGSHTKIWGHHETFHVFVLLGSISHYIFVINYLV